MNKLILTILICWGVLVGSSQEPIATVRDGFIRSEKELANGMIEAVFEVPADFLTRDLDDPIMVEDPFGTELPKHGTALERAGIVFAEGATAVYVPEEGILLVTQTASEMKKVRKYVRRWWDAVPRNVKIRVEVYEMATVAALAACDSAASSGIHNPEREAIVKMVEQGGAKLVASLNCLAGLEAESSIANVYEITAFSGFEKQKESEVDRYISTYDTFEVGTILDVTPTIENNSVKIEYRLTHHTAAPEVTRKKQQVPNTDEFREVEITEFHRKVLDSVVNVSDGNYSLIGNWRPSGKPEYESNALMHVAFLFAKIAPTSVPGQTSK